jgi:hypothetical protein
MASAVPPHTSIVMRMMAAAAGTDSLLFHDNTSGALLPT